MTSLRDDLGFQRGHGIVPWHRLAACKDYPLSRFYEELGSDQKQRGEGDPRPKRICARCPVRRECMTEALEFEQGRWQKDERGVDTFKRHLPVGTYGGMNERERWAPDITHLDECVAKRTCRGGCRPIPQRVEMLEARFRDQAEAFLTRGEEMQ